VAKDKDDVKDDGKHSAQDDKGTGKTSDDIDPSEYGQR
jgi:hypothetical protein